MTTRTAAAVLTEARRLIDCPANWTQGALSRDSSDRVTGPLQPDAARFSIAGACIKAAGTTCHDSRSTQVITALNAAVMAKIYFGHDPESWMKSAMIGGYFTVIKFSDSRDHAAACAVLDAAIAYAHANYGDDD